MNLSVSLKQAQDSQMLVELCPKIVLLGLLLEMNCAPEKENKKSFWYNSLK